MLTSEYQIIFIGNLNSNLFRQRTYHLLALYPEKKFKIINTGYQSFYGRVRFIFTCAWVMLKILMSANPVGMILHGAYSPVLWPMLFVRYVRTVSILQGSELNIDFIGIRARLITLILKRSILIVCRNTAQKDEAVRLCGVKSKQCVIVNWGLKKELFDLPLKHRSGDPVLISPRATQSEYNIPVIFSAVAKLKKDGYRLHFIYVRFNSTFAPEGSSIADEILESPEQSVLWGKIAEADLCVSVPDYDGLSNTIIETLALGSMPIYSDLPPYEFLKQDDRLGVCVGLRGSFEQKVEFLCTSLKYALSNIEQFRSNAEFRRSFAERHFREDSGVDRIIEALNV